MSGSPVTEACEYCNREDGVLYGWHADTWCRECIERNPHVEMIGSLDDAQLGPGSAPSYSHPFIIQYQQPETKACRHPQAEPVILSTGELVACVCITCLERLVAHYIRVQYRDAEREAYCTHDHELDITGFGQAELTLICSRCGHMRLTERTSR